MLGWGACLQVTTALLREAQSMEGVIICGEEDGGFGVFLLASPRRVIAKCNQLS